MKKDTENYKIGLDIGSTTIKIAVLDSRNRILYKEYKRHLSDLKNTILSVVTLCSKYMGDIPCRLIITGSGGLSLAKWLDLPFEQEVIACTKAVETYLPQADTVIELGGEDAKVTYLKPVTEQRMNNSCAGGTGSFIDQMAALFHTDAAGLNEYAKSARTIYPIASRCGVFAKTDIQPLLNDGARKEDIAASIFQAVVNQTIEGLSWGKPIKGKVVFLGGPLYFLTELRERFIETLHPEEVLIPSDGLFFPAIGSALLTEERKYSEIQRITLKELAEKLEQLKAGKETKTLAPLFSTLEEYKSFKKRHEKCDCKRMPLIEYAGEVFLGVDAGSTTLKAVLIGNNGELLYEHYEKSAGDPVGKTAEVLKDIYEQLPEDVRIAGSCVTGYGEELIKRAFRMDMSEIETIAHLRGARFFEPRVDFLLDIGGQDMKCLRLKNGAVDNILLNEACSSGCGSFLESFAQSLQLTVEEFANLGLFSLAPVDLGTKCTVFMNSKVKQAQKEGAEISDLSAGLSYSVIKNAIYKVIKIRDEKELGNHIVVQGGTFLNDSVLRCFELITGKKVLRPKTAGLMGAFGAALLAKDNYKEGSQSTLKNKDMLKGYRIETESKRCESCTNHCLLTINRLGEKELFITGNRCERGLGMEESKKHKVPNLYAYKYKKLFSYKPLSEESAVRGIIGVPRALSMYENYPFWFTLLTYLGFRVILSAPSSKDIYQKGMDSIPADSVCYPAKLSHGHVMDLIGRGIRTIFYPSIVYERKEYEEADNCFNCPIVISYGEVLRNNIEAARGITFISPFLNMNDDSLLSQNIAKAFYSYQVTLKEAKDAVKRARTEFTAFREDIQKKGEETLAFLKDTGKHGIVLCGKPYHIDPEIHHGIPEMIEGFGMAVLTEDSISHLVPLKSKLRVVDQWAYNSRLYRAAEAAGREECLEFIQLNSFGCGLDSITSDQLIEILHSHNRQYTLIKIDEGMNLGAARIRIRSLIAASKERRKEEAEDFRDYGYENKLFTKENRKKHTILAPQMAPLHFELIREAANKSGYLLEILPDKDDGAIEEGLKYVNNDACYPAVLLIGQIVHALKSGKYDINNTSVILSQTGGGCRATNYMSFLKLGLRQAGFGNIPIISLNVAGLGEQPGFKLSLVFVQRLIMAVLYGDLFMKLLYGTRPYEAVRGTSEKLYEKWREASKDNIRNAGKRQFDRNVAKIISEFDEIETTNERKPKVAIVGEILAKYHPMANGDIIKTLEEGGAEVVLPDFLDFFFYSLYNSRFKYHNLGGKKTTMDACSLGIHYLSYYRKTIIRELNKSKHFKSPSSIEELAEKAKEVLSLGNQTGEGWLITAEMIHSLENGVPNILCVQPLACLPNHITGRGMFKAIKERYPKANIMPIDYDPGISQVNQINRVRLMLSVALKTES